MAYGLRPVNSGFSRYSGGGFTEYPIADGYATSIFTGDLIKRVPAGVVERLAATPTGASAALSTIGVAVGFRWVDINGIPQWGQYYPGSADNTDAFAFVVDDPSATFMIKEDSVGGTLTTTAIGANAPVVIAAGSTATGNSGVMLDSSLAAATATLALRILGILQNGENENSSQKDLIVRINPDVHQALNGLGLALA